MSDNPIFQVLIIAYFVVLLGSCSRTAVSPLPITQLALTEASCRAAACHRRTPLINYPPTSGLHSQHLQSRFVADDSAICLNCHWNYDFSPLRRNGAIEGFDARTGRQRFGATVSLSGIFDRSWVSGSYDPRSDNCANVSCHGDGGIQSWYSGRGGCTVCHNSNQKFSNAPDPKSSGVHSAHVKKYDCENFYN